MFLVSHFVSRDYSFFFLLIFFFSFLFVTHSFIRSFMYSFIHLEAEIKCRIESNTKRKKTRVERIWNNKITRKY